MAPGPGYDPAYPISSFDIRFDAEEALEGSAIYGQNVSDPSIDPGRLFVAVPGYFQGDAWVFETDASLTANGPTGCRRS